MALQSTKQDAKRPSALPWIFVFALLLGGWKFWDRQRDAAEQARAASRARLSAAQIYLLGSSAVGPAGAGTLPSAEWRDAAGNLLRVHVTGEGSLAAAGQFAGPDGAVSVIEAALDPSSLPFPANRPGGNDPFLTDRIGSVTFRGMARSAAAEARGTLSVRALGTAPAQPRPTDGQLDRAQRLRGSLPVIPDEVEVTWSPDGGGPTGFRLIRTP